MNNKWTAAIILGVVLLLLIGLLIYFIARPKEEPDDAKFYMIGNEIIRIEGPDVTPPPDAVIGFFDNDEYHPIVPGVTLPPSAQPVYPNPEDHPGSPTEPPVVTTAPPTQDSATPTASTPTMAPTDDPNSQIGIGGDDGGAWSDREQDDWEDGAIIVDWEDLFGTDAP